MKWGKLCLEKLRNWTRWRLAAQIVPTSLTEEPTWRGILKDTTLPTSVCHVCTAVKHLLPIMPSTLMCQGSTGIQNKSFPNTSSSSRKNPIFSYSHGSLSRKCRVPKNPGPSELQDCDSESERIQMHQLWACLQNKAEYAETHWSSSFGESWTCLPLLWSYLHKPLGSWKSHQQTSQDVNTFGV